VDLEHVSNRKGRNLDLYRKVLLASASFPIVFPPVEIDGHLFIDGAARSNIVILGWGERAPWVSAVSAQVTYT
jgi:predicted acylesterase/phospholipase RssA